jgi:LPXTG-motif cell wall-anchored protein
MVDNVNPNTQFHPYQPQDAIPQADAPRTTGLGGILSRVGLDQGKLDSLNSSISNMDVRGQLTRMRGAAQKNPSLVLGGLAALAIGAGLMRRRSSL